MPRRFALIKSLGRKGECTLVLTGCTTAPTAVYQWTLQGDLVVLTLKTSGSHAGVSNAGTFTLTGLPAEIQPSIDASGDINLQPFRGLWYITPANPGVIDMFKWVVAGADVSLSNVAWPAAGTKGIVSQCHLIYRLRRG